MDISLYGCYGAIVVRYISCSIVNPVTYANFLFLSVETIAFCIPVQSAENKRTTRKYLIDAKAKFFISWREVVGKAQYNFINPQREFQYHQQTPLRVYGHLGIP